MSRLRVVHGFLLQKAIVVNVLKGRNFLKKKALEMCELHFLKFLQFKKSLSWIENERIKDGNVRFLFVVCHAFYIREILWKI